MHSIAVQFLLLPVSLEEPFAAFGLYYADFRIGR